MLALNFTGFDPEPKKFEILRMSALTERADLSRTSLGQVKSSSLGSYAVMHGHGNEMIDLVKTNLLPR
jgi:hypothetical protein